MASGAFPQTFPGLGHHHAQSIEDFEAQMAAAKQLLLPPSSPSGAAAETAYATPPFSSQSSQPRADDGHPPLKAGRAWSSEAVAAFNNLCLKNAVANAFEYAQCREIPPGWAVVLRFGFYGTLEGGAEGERFEVSLAGPYGSKKEAKAAAAEEGLRVLGEAIARRGAPGKRKKPSGDAEMRDAESEDENENWVGLLGGMATVLAFLVLGLESLVLTVVAARVLPGRRQTPPPLPGIQPRRQLLDGVHHARGPPGRAVRRPQRALQQQEGGQDQRRPRRRALAARAGPHAQEGPPHQEEDEGRPARRRRRDYDASVQLRRRTGPAPDPDAPRRRRQRRRRGNFERTQRL